MKVKRSRRADANIIEIYKYTTRQFGETQAELYLGGLDYSFDLLKDNPRMGKRISGKRHRYLYKEHYVFYKVEIDHVLILQVRSARMKLPKSWL